MNLTRLMTLGLLASGGPQHGHELRLHAERSNVSAWGGVSVGALHRELKTMDGLGMVEAVLTESVNGRPPRTIYRITERGREELHTLRCEAISETHLGPDRLGVALLFGTISDAEMLAGLLRQRRARLVADRDGVVAEWTRLSNLAGVLANSGAKSMFRRRQLQIEAELAWLDECEQDLLRAVASTDDEKSRS